MYIYLRIYLPVKINPSCNVNIPFPCQDPSWGLSTLKEVKGKLGSRFAYNKCMYNHSTCTCVYIYIYIHMKNLDINMYIIYDCKKKYMYVYTIYTLNAGILERKLKSFLFAWHFLAQSAENKRRHVTSFWRVLRSHVMLDASYSPSIFHEAPANYFLLLLSSL